MISTDSTSACQHPLCERDTERVRAVREGGVTTFGIISIFHDVGGGGLNNHQLNYANWAYKHS